MKYEFPLGDVLHRSRLTTLQRKYLLETTLGLEKGIDSRTKLTTDECLTAWVAEFLNRLHWTDEGQWRLLLDEMSGALYQMAKGIEAGGSPTCLLSFVDGQYATWTGTTKFLDLKTGDWIDELAHRGFEHIGYDLLTLVLIESRRCTQLKETHNASPRPTRTPVTPTGLDRP